MNSLLVRWNSSTELQVQKSSQTAFEFQALQSAENISKQPHIPWQTPTERLYNLQEIMTWFLWLPRVTHPKPQPYSRYATELCFKRKFHRKHKKNPCCFKRIAACIQRHSKGAGRTDCMGNEQRVFLTQLNIGRSGISFTKN